MRIDVNQYIAKSDGTSLVRHTQNVITALKRVYECRSTINQSIVPFERAQFCAVYHDIGKCHQLFQHRVAPPSKRAKRKAEQFTYRHELLSAWVVQQCYEVSDEELFAIATHHRGIVSLKDSKGRLSKILLEDIGEYMEYDGTLRKYIAELVESWHAFFKVERPIKADYKRNLEQPLQFRSSLYDLLFEYEQEEVSAGKRYNAASFRAVLMLADHLGSAHFTDKLQSIKQLSEHDILPRNPKTGEVYPFRKFQQELLNVQEDVILHAPTGSGKTEAALAWIYRNQQEGRSIFYLLPYIASLNAMHERMTAVFGENQVVPLHSRAKDFFYGHLAEEFGNLEKKDIEQARNMLFFTRELVFPVRLSTPHQLIKLALMGKGWEMALNDLQGALVIVDEFHTYDAFLTGMSMAVFNFLKKEFNVRFLFMSATIPAFLEEKLKQDLNVQHIKTIRPDENYESDRQIMGRVRHKLYCIDGRIDSRTEDLHKAFEQAILSGKQEDSCIVMVNNVSTCQKIYNNLPQCIKDETVLLHSGFHKKDRDTIEKRITSATPPSILIATQAVEVSLDIDYGVAFIENAPVDALIQRLGRVNRAGKRKDAGGKLEASPVYVFSESIGNIGKIYDSEVMDKTWSELQKHDQKELTEQSLIDICNIVYENGYTKDQEEDYSRGLNHSLINNFRESIRAGSWKDWVEQVLENDKMKIEVLPVDLYDEYKAYTENHNYYEASRLLVGVYPWQIKEGYKGALSDRKHSDTNIYLKNLKYSIGKDGKTGSGMYFELDDNSENQLL